MRRALMLVAAVAIPVSLGVVGAGQAWAKSSGPKGKVTCTSISGSDTGTSTISGCTDLDGANTGPGSQPLNSSSLATGGTITWDSGFTTTVSPPSVVSTNAKKCPGYVKNGANNPSADKISASVTADTSGLKVPGKLKGAVCISSGGEISALKPFKFS